MSQFSDSMTLGEARDELRGMVGKGHRCPLCTQYAKIYKRPLPSATCRVMIALYRHRPDANGEYTFLPPILDTLTGTAHQGGYGTLAHHWGLLEQQVGERDDGSTRVGWWRLTESGVAFVRERLSVPKYAHLYAERLLRLSGEPVTIRRALGHKFNYDELMGGL